MLLLAKLDKFFEYCSGISGQYNKTLNQKKRYDYWQAEEFLLFADIKFAHLVKARESIEKLLELLSTFQIVTGCRVIIKKSIV